MRDFVIELEAFEAPKARSAAARRGRLAEESDRVLAGRLVRLAQSLRETDVVDSALGAAAGIRLGEVLASPFALRIVAQAVASGATTVHGDLRHVLDADDGEEGTVDPDHGTWDRGVLTLGKFEQFRQDEPFAIFHADHVSKWGPHELMHRTCGFFLRPGCSRWELYLGARLNELLPVVTFYGIEQAMRLDEGAFDRFAAGKKPKAKIAAAHWLRESTSELRERALRAVPLLRKTLAHFERELAAIDQEISTAQRVVTRDGTLDASSDALAYVAGHRARLERDAEAIAALVPAGEVRFESIASYRRHIEEVFDRLLFAPLEVELDLASAKRSGRTLWDLVHRGLRGSPEAADLARDLAFAAGKDVGRAMQGEPIDLEAWRERLLSLGDDVLANGDRVQGVLALDQLVDGLSSCVPVTLDGLDGRAIEVVAEFAESDSMLSREPLATRFSKFLHDHGDEPGSELAHLEAMIAAARSFDDRIERLGEPLDALWENKERAIFWANEAFRLARFESDVAAVHAGMTPRSGSSVLLVGAFGERISVVELSEEVARAFEWLKERPRTYAAWVAKLDRSPSREGLPENADEWIRELFEAGAVGWTLQLVTSRSSGAQKRGRSGRREARSRRV